MKISIVTSYFNRKKLLINTLKSIEKTTHEDFEFIIVDDASDDENRIEDLVENYPFVKIFRVEPENKWYSNPCIPFNIGFSKAEGDIVIIQNPECFHTTDILTFVNNNLKENDYFSFGCYSLNEENTQQLLSNPDHCKIINFKPKRATLDGEDAWYNHSVFRPVGYHFTSAIFKTKLDKLGGFDERFANGNGYDDDEFLYRVKKICDFRIIDEMTVLHQYHYNQERGHKFHSSSEINKELFFKKTLQEETIRVNI